MPISICDIIPLILDFPNFSKIRQGTLLGCPIFSARKIFMNHKHGILMMSVFVFAVFVISGCSKTNKPSIDEGEEESKTELALNESYDRVRNGARLILAYDAQSNSFKGTVENTTEKTLKRVRVEVHLSNGKELGPTPATDLAPVKKMEVHLMATSTDFDGWTAHPEVGEDEHSHGEEHGEHDSEHGGEHDREGKDEHN